MNMRFAFRIGLVSVAIAAVVSPAAAAPPPRISEAEIEARVEEYHREMSRVRAGARLRSERAEAESERWRRQRQRRAEILEMLAEAGDRNLVEEAALTRFELDLAAAGGVNGRFPTGTVALGMLQSEDGEAEELGDGEPLPAEAPAGGGGGGDLAASAQNPIASTVSIPYQSNFYIGGVDSSDFSYTGLFQPVIPVSLNDEWNLINRPIVPITYMQGLTFGLPDNPGTPGLPDSPGSIGNTFGLGDINYTAFFSPAKNDGLIWGLGPSITIPTATDDLLGSGKWSAGPSFVGLVIKKPILAGVLITQLWSFAGDDDRSSVNRTSVQPFLNYNLEDGWYLVTSPIFSANWAAKQSRDEWTIPLGGGVGRLMKWGDQPVNMNVQVYNYVVSPANSPEWQIQFTIQFMFPK